MHDAEDFRQAVQQRRRAAGRTQQQLARAIGLHPDVLSHKLHQSGAVLTTADVTAIVITLAGWGAVASRADARALLALMAVPPYAIPVRTWTTPPLGALPDGPDPAGADPAGADLAGADPAGADPAGADPAGAEPAGLEPRGAGGGDAGAHRYLPRSRADGESGDGRLVAARLPVPLTPLVGRAAEVTAVVAAVGDGRLVTLTGTGGTGKTRVALRAATELAGRFPDGVAFADLAPLRDPDLVAVTLLRAIGLSPRSAAAAEDQLAAALAPAHLLLVVDNMEHLVEQAPLLGRLLAAAPRLHLLVTSRIPLALYGEQQLRVPPLRLPGDAGEAAASDPAAGGPAPGNAASVEAVQLFIQRARAVLPGFAPHEADLAATAAICAALDGLPLAIELAAARVRLYPPQALLARLRDRLSLLTGGPRDLPQRQRTIRAALDWSDALLPGSLRDVFSCLGVFAGPFDAEAAAAVCGARPPDLMLDQLATLGEHGLLEVTPGLTPRFAMLATVREYAQARLAESGQADPVHDRHLHYYLTLATQAGLDGPEQAAWLDRLEAEFADIRAALGWARAHGHDDGERLERGLRLAVAVSPIWRRRGSLAEGALHLERLLAVDAERGSAAPATRAWAVLQSASMACFRGDYPATTALAGRGLALCQELGDLAGLAWAHRYLGEAAMAGGEVATAGRHFECQLALALRAGDRWGEGAARNMLGQAGRYQGRYAEAEQELQRAVQAFRAAGDPNGLASALNSLGEVARDAGRPGRARDLFRQALRGHRQTGSERGMAADLEGIAISAAMLGEGRAALVYLGAARALRQASGGMLLPVEQDLIDRLLEANLGALDPGERARALAEGRSRPLDAVIAEALDG